MAGGLGPLGLVRRLQYTENTPRKAKHILIHNI